jgi:hypothetical protein
MVHCTVKGFFKLKDGSKPEDLIPALDELFSSTPAFQTGLVEVIGLNGPPYGPTVLLEMARTYRFHKLHEGVWNIVRPHIAPDCLFSPIEPAGGNFLPHITLGMKDPPIEPGLFRQFEQLARYVFEQLPKEPWTATDMQFIEFYSEDWAGKWWETLNYKQLKGWQLKTA